MDWKMSADFVAVSATVILVIMASQAALAVHLAGYCLRLLEAAKGAGVSAYDRQIYVILGVFAAWSVLVMTRLGWRLYTLLDWLGHASPGDQPGLAEITVRDIAAGLSIVILEMVGRVFFAVYEHRLGAALRNTASAEAEAECGADTDNQEQPTGVPAPRESWEAAAVEECQEG
jgi:hypothetical protein